MMSVLVAACPSFAPQWQEFQDEWRNEEGDPPLYSALSEFAIHLINMLECSNTQNFPVIFETIERLHVEGEHYVREAATVGLLEDLQNFNLHKNGTDPEQFYQYLGPISARWWEKLHRFWRNGELLAEDKPLA
jgi:hypothetical protein